MTGPLSVDTVVGDRTRFAHAPVATLAAVLADAGPDTDDQARATLAWLDGRGLLTMPAVNPDTIPSQAVTLFTTAAQRSILERRGTDVDDPASRLDGVAIRAGLAETFRAMAPPGPFAADVDEPRYVDAFRRSALFADSTAAGLINRLPDQAVIAGLAGAVRAGLPVFMYEASSVAFHYEGTPRVEHGVLIAGGAYQVRPDTPEVERQYPLRLWLDHMRAQGSRIGRRVVVECEPWQEAP